jgi:hypothetical protein
VGRLGGAGDKELLAARAPVLIDFRFDRRHLLTLLRQRMDWLDPILPRSRATGKRRSASRSRLCELPRTRAQGRALDEGSGSAAGKQSRSGGPCPKDHRPPQGRQNTPPSPPPDI